MRNKLPEYICGVSLRDESVVRVCRTILRPVFRAERKPLSGLRSLGYVDRCNAFGIHPWSVQYMVGVRMTDTGLLVRFVSVGCGKQCRLMCPLMCLRYAGYDLRRRDMRQKQLRDVRSKICEILV